MTKKYDSEDWPILSVGDSVVLAELWAPSNVLAMGTVAGYAEIGKSLYEVYITVGDTTYVYEHEGRGTFKSVSERADWSAWVATQACFDYNPARGGPVWPNYPTITAAEAAERNEL